ncbi:hypothetical protein F5Y15DRAFT_416914 [Xylariaceae sp. FL0016]|nr:hypothetical protein F5Y15DRAFT_416914 [Xylariaceae sp. FL0016]
MANIQARRRPGLKLSWPSSKGSRRSIVGLSPRTNEAGHTTEARFVHFNPSDFAMHHLAASFEHGSHAPGVQTLSVPLSSIPYQLNPVKPQLNEQELLYYFQYAASQALVTVGCCSSSELGNILLSISLSNDDESSKAVFYALLAFSSLHRHGAQYHADELKISALRALAHDRGFGGREAVKHAAAGMLLYSYEVLDQVH